MDTFSVHAEDAAVNKTRDQKRRIKKVSDKPCTWN